MLRHLINVDAQFRQGFKYIHCRGKIILNPDCRMTVIAVCGKRFQRDCIDRIGINGRLDSIQAAVLLEKLAIFDEELEVRQRVADFYSSRLQH